VSRNVAWKGEREYDVAAVPDGLERDVDVRRVSKERCRRRRAALAMTTTFIEQAWY
jgi:hypothetical protein